MDVQCTGKNPPIDEMSESFVRSCEDSIVVHIIWNLFRFGLQNEKFWSIRNFGETFQTYISKKI